MSNEMIERAMIAVHAAQQAAMEIANRTGLLSQRELDRVAVLAVIGVLRNPTETMLQASEREWDGRMSYRSTGAWQAMLDAAVAPPEQSDG